MRVSYTMVYVHDMDRAVGFYRDVLGFPLKFQSPGWSEFISEGSTLALHAAGKSGRGPEAFPPSAGSCRPGFSVPSLDAFHQRMVEHLDPDGLVFSVGEERRTG